MPLSEDTEALLLDYVYGELSESAARAFEERLAGDAELRAEMEGLRATRSLLGDDAAWGLRSGTDAPPPHLVDAILRAEALARPPQIRDAGLVQTKPPLVARMSRWLLGGGVLVGAAAAVFIVATQTDRSAPELTLAPAAKMEDAPMPAPPPPVATSAGDGLFAEEEAGQEKQVFADKKAGADQPRPQPEAKTAPEGNARGVRAMVEDLDARADTAGPRAGAVASREAKPETVALAPTPAANKAADPHAPTLLDPQPVAPRPPPPPAEVPAQADELAAPAPAKKAKSPDSYDDAETGFDRLDVKQRAKDEALTKAKESARAEASKPAAKTEAKYDRLDVEEARKRIAAERAARAPSSPSAQARDMQAELALLSGQRELARGNPLIALDEFEKAARLDPRHELGSDPTLGQMRALVALKRPADALRLVATVTGRKLEEPGVVDAIMLGADLAEKLGDTRRARELWSLLLKAPAPTSTTARKNVDRLAPKALRAAPADASSEAASPAASEPASKR